MQFTTCVLMTKKHLDKYIEMLDQRIEFLRVKKERQTDYDRQESCMYIAMRNHAYEAMEIFR